MDEELTPVNQGIDDMSFKDLTTRAAAAIAPKPAKNVKTPVKENESKASGNEAPAKSRSS